MRVGKVERALIRDLRRKIRGWSLVGSEKRDKETELYNKLYYHVLKAPRAVSVERRRSPRLSVFGERLLPDFFLVRGRSPVCAVECKKLDDSKSAKKIFKDGLSQAMLYSIRYKAVILVLFDFTKRRVYAKAFGRGNRPESRFAKHLRRSENIKIIVFTPTDR